MELSEFNSDYLTNLLEKLSLENKTLVLLGDFDVDLLKCVIQTMTFQTSLIQCIHPFFFHTLPGQLVLQQHQQPSLTIYLAITATLHTFLVILSSHCMIIMLNS